MDQSPTRPDAQAQASRLFQRALQRHREGALEDAAGLYHEVLELQPAHLAALSNRGAALRDLGRPAEALACYDRVLEIQPGHVWSLNNRGVALIDLGRTQEAVASFERALSLKPDYAEALNNRGRALAGLLDGPPRAPDEALASYNRAIALDPAYAEAHDNRGLLLFELGRFEEAAAAVERAISLQPARARYYHHLAEIRAFRPDDPELAALRALAERAHELDPDDQVLLRFALAKALADVGDHAGSFEQLSQGAALKRSRIAYDETATLGALTLIRKCFTRRRVLAGAAFGEPSAAPVFIVGLPRSGTSLVEQILASHPDVFTIGESDAFAEALAAEHVDFPDGAARLGQEALRRLGARYLDPLEAAAPDAARIVNKRPDNFRFCGLIAMALPGARIIHLRREPLDVCVSCFSKLFGESLPYTFDLGELGRYHRAYEALMAHWREALPEGVLLEVSYENLIAGPPGEVARILAHCGLDWDDRCLDFHLTQRRIRTASATQVRRPIYTSAIGRWRAYEPFLGPLIEALGEG